jgi:hypothetical protein
VACQLSAEGSLIEAYRSVVNVVNAVNGMDALLTTTSPDADKPQRAVAAWAARDEPATKEGVVSEGELYRLQRAIERLMAGHREVLGVIDQEVEDQEVEDQESSAQETLAEVQDILSGALEDAQSILDGEEGRT